MLDGDTKETPHNTRLMWLVISQCTAFHQLTGRSLGNNKKPRIQSSLQNSARFRCQGPNRTQAKSKLFSCSEQETAARRHGFLYLRVRFFVGMNNWSGSDLDPSMWHYSCGLPIDSSKVSLVRSIAALCTCGWTHNYSLGSATPGSDHHLLCGKASYFQTQPVT
jgi:hypothetical protein